MQKISKRAQINIALKYENIEYFVLNPKSTLFFS